MSEAEQIYFNPWDEAFRANPYPYYRPLMMGPPRLLNVFLPMALVARYADCAAVLRDHERFSSVPPRSPFLEERISVFGDAPRVVFSDPPVHTEAAPAGEPRLYAAAHPRTRGQNPRIH